MIPDEAVEAEMVRLSVNLNQETALAIKRIACRSGTSVTEGIRRAISIYKFLQDENLKGRKIHVMDYDGSNVRELVFE
jgi:hypothetical protein